MPEKRNPVGRPPLGKKVTSTAFKLTAALKKRADVAAAAQEQSLSAFIRDAIEHYLKVLDRRCKK